jgi:hypothetical protein
MQRNILKALAVIVSMCGLHVTFNRKYTKIFYVIYKQNIMSFQCKTSLWQTTIMRGTDGLSLIFIDFYVPVLTISFH